MAVFVLMLKELEDEDRVVYLYGPNENSMWRIEYDKKNRVINQLSPIDSKEFADDFFFKTAGRRLSRMIIKENQNFVDRTNRLLINAIDFSVSLLNLGIQESSIAYEP